MTKFLFLWSLKVILLVDPAASLCVNVRGETDYSSDEPQTEPAPSQRDSPNGGHAFLNSDSESEWHYCLVPSGSKDASRYHIIIISKKLGNWVPYIGRLGVGWARRRLPYFLFKYPRLERFYRLCGPISARNPFFFGLFEKY